MEEILWTVDSVRYAANLLLCEANRSSLNFLYSSDLTFAEFLYHG